MTRKKSPGLAALLNIIPFPMGLGFLYLGRPGRFALALLGTLLALGAGFVVVALAFLEALSEEITWAAPVLVLAPMPLLLLAGFTAWDAYSLASGTARMGWSILGKLSLALMLLGMPVTLGVLLLNPLDLGQSRPWVDTVAVSPAFATDRILFARGKNGIFRSTNAGESWQQASEELSTLFGYAWAFSPTFAMDHTVFAFSVPSRGIVRSTDDGGSWERASQGLPGYVSTVAMSQAFATDRTLFAGGNEGIFRSTNAGESWEQANHGLPDSVTMRTWQRKGQSELLVTLAISPDYAKDRTLFATFTGVSSVDSEGIFRSTDAGETWQRATLGIGPGVPGLALSPTFATDRTLFAVAYSHYSEGVSHPGGIFRSTDAGETWQRSQGIEAATFIHTVTLSPNFATDRTLFAATSEGIFRSTDGGVTWERVQGSPTAIETLAISPDYATDHTIFGEGKYHFSGIFRSTDSGESWQRSQGIEPSAFSHAVTLSPNFATDRTLFGLAHGDIFRSNDGGENWLNLGRPGQASRQVPAAAFTLGIVFVLVLAGALLFTWAWGVGAVAGSWRLLWAVAGLGVGVLLIALGLVDESTRLVYLGEATLVLLVMGFLGSVAKTAIIRRLRRL